jgi:hypothetical protein
MVMVMTKKEDVLGKNENLLMMRVNYKMKK